jgi:hypothetical protein
MLEKALRVLLAPAFLAILAAGRAADLPLIFSDDFEPGPAAAWRPSDPAHWRAAGETGARRYELTAPGAPGKVRAPASWSVIGGRDVSRFVFTGRLRCDADPSNPKRDLDVIFHFRDPEHFAYVHFAASSDDIHNIIGLVDGADRVKVNLEPAGKSAARLIDRGWHVFKVTCDAAGRIEAFLDDPAAPILTARLSPRAHGLVGVGSFDDTGAFDRIRLRGE